MSRHEGGGGGGEEKTDYGPQGGERHLDIKDAFIALLTYLDITLYFG